jgi:hypothetical protein
MDIATLNLTFDETKRNFVYRKGTADEIVIVQALKNGAYKFGQLRRAKELADLYDRLAQTKKPPLIVDSGANIGASALYFAFAFPKAHLIAIESEQANFQLLVTNTAHLPIECLRATISANENAAPPVTRLSINEIYKNTSQTAQPFIVKIDSERCESGLFAVNTEWLDRTPVIILQLQDCLIPGTKNSRAFVECVVGRNRDFIYLHDCIFSIDRELVHYTVQQHAA